MTRHNAIQREGGFATTAAIVVLAAVLLATLAGVAWLAVNRPPPPQVVQPVVPAATAGAPSPSASPTLSAAALPPNVQDGNARVRLRYTWLAASDYARVHGSFTGFSPAYAAHRLRATAGDVSVDGEGSLVLTTTFDRGAKARAGVVSIRVASGRALLLVTRSASGKAYCFVQRGEETGGGVGDVHGVAQCVIRWG
jgi:hypothetical protein